MKLCKFCGEKIEEEKMVCPYCGKKVIEEENKSIIEEEKEEEINYFGLQKHKYNKWISLFLCLFLGIFGAHKFYERKYFMGILYFLTFGFFGIGWILDIYILWHKPNPYYLYQ